jgi:phage gpG-like protein
MTSLGSWIARLDRLPIAATQARLLGEAAARLQASTEENLSHPPGASHAMPWQRTGALRDSIAASVEADAVVVGSTSIVAVAQELGTAILPPRPFLAPGARDGEAIADSFGAAFAALLQGAAPE